MTAFAELARASLALAELRGRNDKIDLLVTLLRAVSADEVAATIAFLSGEPRAGKIGVGGALAHRLSALEAESSGLGVLDVERRLVVTRALSAQGREEVLTELFSSLGREERTFLAQVLAFGLRQGSLEGVMLAAVARAYAVPEAEVRRATMATGDLAGVGESLATTGRIADVDRDLQLFRPVLPMLAQPADDVGAALRELSATAKKRGDQAPVAARIDWKMDGARVQIHRHDERLAAYSRQRNDVSLSCAPILERLRREVPSTTFVLDGEVVLFDAGGRPQAFQDTMSRFSRESGASPGETLRFFAFDLLHEGESLLDRPLSERLERLAALVPEDMRIPSLVTVDVGEAQRFYDASLAAGHEGLVVKRLDAPYVAGARGDAWQKVKKVVTVDLVILAAEWGHGRRKGKLSNLHLGARGDDGFVMVGKTFKGLTDAMLAFQTERLLALEDHRDEGTVYVRPELGVEIAFSDVQRSSRYPAGIALRLARVVAHREDKRPAEADTVATLRAMLPAEPAPPPPAAPAPQLALFGDVAPAPRKRRR